MKKKYEGLQVDWARTLLGEPHNPFPNYRYTGPLKAVYPLSPKRQVPDHIPKRMFVWTIRVAHENQIANGYLSST